MRNVSVSLNPHNQIEVRVGTESRSGESYYLGLQPDSGDHEFRPAAGTLQLISEWIRLLSESTDGDRLFLPFDFSDEYTRWLSVHRDGRSVSITFGWATVEGWAISPRNFSEYAHNLPGFQPDEPIQLQSFYLPRVLNDLQQCRSELVELAERERLHRPESGTLLA